MKHMKRIAALALAIMMLLSLATTAFAAEGDGTYTITINNELDGHTYEAYQIFKGDLSKASENDNSDGTNAVLSNIEWGSGISDEGKAKLQEMYGAENAAGVAEALTASNVKAFAAEVSKYLTTTFASTSTKTNNQYIISGLEAGYYLVKDQNGSLNNDHDAYTSYIIEVIENSTVNPKSAFPTVDKQVQDEVADKEANADNNGWGETADHAINESFQFKLIANLPADTNFASYETYKVIFNDTMSNGITFEQIVSVTVDNIPLTSGQYDETIADNQVGGSWSLTITDIKSIDGVNLTDGAVIEVIYRAHLNENAVIGNSDANKNTVNLQYSNNPNASGEGHTEVGKTPDDTVWVFTYEMKNTKTTGTGEKLEGATFAIKNEAGQYYGGVVNGVVTWVESQNPVSDQNVYKVTSDANGDFTVKGLDVGTYILTEIVTPAGYNTCADVTVVISAVHKELTKTTAETVITMTKGGESATEIVVINNAGVTLPETGGIGTTLFYALGGLMVIAAAVLLVTRKRMANFE